MNSYTANNINGQTKIWSRYEMKYLVSESKAAAIAHFIRPYVHLDRYCEGKPNSSYPIVSLYLDSQNLRLCRESLEGHKNRFKLRIRSYTDEPDYPRFVEIKRRVNSVIIKGRSQLKHDNIANLLSGLSLSGAGFADDDETLRQFRLYLNSIQARPVIRTRYQRQAFESIANNSVRITFDRDLCYNVTPIANVGLNGRGWQKILLNYIVLEIKFTGRFPAWLSQMVKCFELRQQSVSKYARSVKRACLLKFCAPKITGGYEL